MGVKSLWTLLTPVGRPVMFVIQCHFVRLDNISNTFEMIRLETVEGKSMAIDSSIWIYQFQATMRDKDGRALSNAHVLGFLRRITKLLFYGIKPVFVFDGGAPALKRATLVCYFSAKIVQRHKLSKLLVYRLRENARRAEPLPVMRK
jgi:DNA excision repair protein ERCC-5